MLEEMLLQFLYLSLVINVALAIISITLIVAITINLCKKNHISADQ